MPRLAADTQQALDTRLSDSNESNPTLALRSVCRDPSRERVSADLVLREAGEPDGIAWTVIDRDVHIRRRLVTQLSRQASLCKCPWERHVLVLEAVRVQASQHVCVEVGEPDSSLAVHRVFSAQRPELARGEDVNLLGDEVDASNAVTREEGEVDVAVALGTDNRWPLLREGKRVLRNRLSLWVEFEDLVANKFDDVEKSVGCAGRETSAARSNGLDMEDNIGIHASFRPKGNAAGVGTS